MTVSMVYSAAISDNTTHHSENAVGAFPQVLSLYWAICPIMQIALKVDTLRSPLGDTENNLELFHDFAD